MGSIKFLPAATKLHLYNLITNKAYRERASRDSYSGGGIGSPGNVTKFGWDATLAAGTAQRMGGPDPGRYRLAAYSDPRSAHSLKWYQMTHVGANSYKFEPLTGIPACPDCNGTGDKLCPDCKGTGRVTTGNFSAACTRCRNTNPLKSGVIACTCGGTCVANGVSVDTNFTKW